MLNSGKIKVFIFLSLVVHLFFTILFGTVTLSFSPPSDHDLSLVLLTRGGGEGEIVQIEAAWPTPPKAEPRFLADRATLEFDLEVEKWTEIGVPDMTRLLPPEDLIPKIEFAELEERVRSGPPTRVFSQLPEGAKPMPEVDFALGPIPAELLRRK